MGNCFYYFTNLFDYFISSNKIKKQTSYFNYTSYQNYKDDSYFDDYDDDYEFL